MVEEITIKELLKRAGVDADDERYQELASYIAAHGVYAVDLTDDASEANTSQEHIICIPNANQTQPNALERKSEEELTMTKKIKPIIVAAGLAAMIGMVGSASVAMADQIYVPWYATAGQGEKAAMTKTVKQTIKYIDKSTGKQMTKLTKDNVQVITFHRQEQWDTETKKPTGVYTDWDGPKSTQAVDSYEYIGYTASKKVVPAQKYSADDEDRVITVYYTRNPVKRSTQTKKITRTIKIYRPKKGLKKVVQKAYIKRKVTTDLKTHKKTYGKWSTSSWKAYKVPKYKGYKASKKTVKKQKVTSKTKNKLVKITYKKNG